MHTIPVDASSLCMAKKKLPGTEDIKAAAQSAVDTAQAVASGALRITPATIQLAAEIPELIENLAAATQRLNEAVDRAERYLALADPMIRTMDALLPQLEAVVKTGNDVFNAASVVPGVATLGRFANLGSSVPQQKKPTKRTPRGPKP
jgi:ABC-type transporter Mla subunit MlaD